MNFLAHLYLSQNKTNLIIGNFIADFIKGNKLQNFNKEIQQGITLHRKIDSFTDAHPTFRKSKRRLHKRYRHYNSIIIDIFYDYFLAKNWNTFSTVTLNKYTKNIYTILKDNQALLPIDAKEFYNYMVEYDILYNYKNLDCIERVLKGMNRRTNGKSQMDLAIEDLIFFEKEFEKDFLVFFKEIEIYVDRIIKLYKVA